jgi:hypothetical protein
MPPDRAGSLCSVISVTTEESVAGDGLSVLVTDTDSDLHYTPLIPQNLYIRLEVGHSVSLYYLRRVLGWWEFSSTAVPQTGRLVSLLHPDQVCRLQRPP